MSETKQGCLLKVSFLMSTKRPFNEFARRVIRNITSWQIYNKVSCEILIYGPLSEFENYKTAIHEDGLSFDYIKYFIDTELNGSITGYNYLYTQSIGEYVVPTPDDLICAYDWSEPIKFLESSVFQDRKFKLCAIGSGGNTMIPSPTHRPEYPTPHIVENDCLVLGMAFTWRWTIERYFNGYIFHPKFKHVWGDNWMPYWMYRMGEGHLVCPDTPFCGFAGSPTFSGDYDKEDFSTFCKLIENLEVHGKRKYVDE